jgi:Leucine-rich repeat (LRR) protein
MLHIIAFLWVASTQLVASEGTWSVALCPPFDVQNTNSATTNFAVCTVTNICQDIFLTFSTCSESEGNTFLRLLDASLLEVANDNDGCGIASGPSNLKYGTNKSICQTYRLVEGCFANTACSGRATVLTASSNVNYEGFCDFMNAVDPAMVASEVRPSLCFHDIPLANPCNLPYVTCDNVNGEFLITEIDLSSYGISGTVPSSIGLSHLKLLNLEHNALHGSIDSDWSHLTQLQHLRLGDNFFTSSIPSRVGSASKLTILSMEQNLFLNTIPPQLCDLSSLLILSASDNHLTGTIPSCLGTLANLSYVYLGYNSFDGFIPSSFGDAAELKRMFLDRNELTGEIPLSLFTHQNLEMLSIADCHIEGSIPSVWSSPGLVSLNVGGNKMTGSLPASIQDITALVELSIYGNEFSMQIPAEIIALTNLEILNAHSNKFIGQIPSELGALQSLTHLDLHSNSLEGQIPQSLANNVNIASFLIQHNSLSGSIPSEIGAWINVEFANVSFNSLHGYLPSSVSLLSSLVSLDVSNNANLGGSIPEAICSNPDMLTRTHQFVVKGTDVECYDSCIDDSTVYVVGQRACDDEQRKDESIVIAVLASIGGLMFVCALIFYIIIPARHLLELKCSGLAAALSSCLRTFCICLGEQSETPQTVSNSFVAVAHLIKLFLALALALSVSRGWEHCQGGGSDIADSCRVETNSLCKSYCGKPDYVMGVCEATLTGECSCEHWETFVLGPLIGFALQFLVHFIFTLAAPSNPQAIQFRVLCDPVASIGLITALFHPLHGIFSAFEVFNIAYMWTGVLVYPPIVCKGYFPYKILIFPAVMTFFECMKFNLYLALQTFLDESNILFAGLVFCRLDSFLCYIFMAIGQTLTFVASVVFVWPIFLGREIFWKTISYYNTSEASKVEFNTSFVRVGSNILMYALLSVTSILAVLSVLPVATSEWLKRTEIVDAFTSDQTCSLTSETKYGLYVYRTRKFIDNGCTSLIGNLKDLYTGSEMGWSQYSLQCEKNDPNCQALLKTTAFCWIAIGCSAALIVLSAIGSELVYRKNKSVFREYVSWICGGVIAICVIHAASTFAAVATWYRFRGLYSECVVYIF